MKPVHRVFQNFSKVLKILLITLILFLVIFALYILFYSNDIDWSGYWSADVNEVDGYPLAMKDYVHLANSNEGVYVKLDVKSGAINGTITSNKICNSQPLLQFVLLKGHVNLLNKSHATVIAYEHSHGYEHDFAKLDMTVSGGSPETLGGKVLPEILTIKGVGGDVSTYPNNIRITKIYQDMRSYGITSVCDAKAKPA